MTMHSHHETPSDKNQRRHVTRQGHGLGWRRQHGDHRDHLFRYSVPEHVARDLPPRAEVDELPIWDQGQLGSCTGNGVGFTILFDAVKQKLLKPDDVPSRLFIYYGERWLEGTIREDAGAEIRDGIKFIAKYGTCLEAGKASWPYDVSKFAQKPPAACWKEALKFQALKYMPVAQTSMDLRGCLAEGFPVVYGFECFPSLESEEAEKTGYVAMPSSSAGSIGGHCVALVGYDDATRRFKFRNSWGEGWGDKGYGYFDYEYVTRSDLSSDFWTVRVVG